MQPQVDSRKFGSGLIAGSPSQFVIKRDYILVKPNALDYSQIICLLSDLISLKDYPAKNTIWHLTGEINGFCHADLYRLSDFMRNHLPKGMTGHKTAFVSGMAFYRAIMDDYAKIAVDLPIEFRVFFSIGEAEEWVRA